jgi:hypothetical protein
MLQEERERERERELVGGEEYLCSLSLLLSNAWEV